MFHRWKVAAALLLLPLAIAGTGTAAAAQATVPTPAVSEPRTVMVPKVDALPKAPVQDYEPRPAMWLISDEDTRIYLFGTTHMLPPGFKWRSPALDKAVKEADELTVETYEEPGAELDPKVIEQLVLQTPVPILERVPRKYRKPLAGAIKRSGLPIEGFALLRTWMAGMMLGLGEQLRAWGADDPSDAPGVEDVLEAEFRAAKKPISSVEGPEAGLDAFNALSEEQQVALLIEGLDSKPDEGEEIDDDRLWATGRFDEVYESFVRDFPPVLYDGLVRKRNAAWTVWLEERMKKPGTVLFAVGAAHLAGEDSVQKMLEKRGIVAERIE